MTNIILKKVKKMKIVKYLVLFLLLSMDLFAGTVTATYSAGTIPTTYIASASIDTSSRAIDPGILTVTIPIGASISSVNIAYTMTATNNAYMSEQRSFIRCISSRGQTETAVYSGVGNSSGTYAYNRTNLQIANNVEGGGDIQFELHAFRTYFGSGSNSTYNYVENNSWQITVNYEYVDPPSNLTMTAYMAQINLSWTKNVANSNVMVAYNTTNIFGTPKNGTVYSSNSSISNGGGTVIYNNSSTSYYHLPVYPSIRYYYKIWSVTNNNYSIGITGNAAPNTVPTVSNVSFVNNIPTTGKVDIYYDVTDAEQNLVAISMEASNDGGNTYNFACTQLTGDIGSGISIGTGKHIIWDFDREHSGVTGSNFKIKILADDQMGDQVYYAGQIYNTIIIGSQTWFMENLNVGTKISAPVNQSNNGIIEKYYYNNSSPGITYGGLYQWNEVMQYVNTSGAQGICPPGWHIPTYAEFQTLYTTVNSDKNALLSSSYGTNTSGFSAIYVGYYEGSFYDINQQTYFWSSTEWSDPTYAYYMNLSKSMSGINLMHGNKNNAYSVRCIKD